MNSVDRPVAASRASRKACRTRAGIVASSVPASCHLVTGGSRAPGRAPAYARSVPVLQTAGRAGHSRATTAQRRHGLNRGPDGACRARPTDRIADAPPSGDPGVNRRPVGLRALVAVITCRQSGLTVPTMRPYSAIVWPPARRRLAHPCCHQQIPRGSAPPFRASPAWASPGGRGRRGPSPLVSPSSGPLAARWTVLPHPPPIARTSSTGRRPHVDGRSEPITPAAGRRTAPVGEEIRSWVTVSLVEPGARLSGPILSRALASCRTRVGAPEPPAHTDRAPPPWPAAPGSGGCSPARVHRDVPPRDGLSTGLPTDSHR